jgi:hypothetical protein
MLTLNNAIGLLVFLAGMIVFLDSLNRVIDQFCKKTPWPVRFGVVFMGIGGLFFLHDPYILGALVIIGRALQVLCGAQVRFGEPEPRRGG